MGFEGKCAIQNDTQTLNLWGRTNIMINILNKKKISLVRVDLVPTSRTSVFITIEF